MVTLNKKQDQLTSCLQKMHIKYKDTDKKQEWESVCYANINPKKYSESINIQYKEYYQGNRETCCKDEIDGKFIKMTQ